jgi:hypothetical protein
VDARRSIPRRYECNPESSAGQHRIDRFQAGESLPDLGEDFGVPIEDLEDALRVASRRVA